MPQYSLSWQPEIFFMFIAVIVFYLTLAYYVASTPASKFYTGRNLISSAYCFLLIVCCCCCQVASVMSDSLQPHSWQPTRLPCPWDSPGKNTVVGCHFLLQYRKVKSESEVAQSCPTLSDPVDFSLPGPIV